MASATPKPKSLIKHGSAMMGSFIMSGAVGRVIDVVFESTRDLQIRYVVVDFPDVKLKEPFFPGFPATYVPIYLCDHSGPRGWRRQLGACSCAAAVSPFRKFSECAYTATHKRKNRERTT